MTRVLRTALAVLLPAVAVAACNDYEADEGDAPKQPIAFYHSVHAGQNQIPCAYCHYTADRSVDAGIPSVQACVGCHVPGSSSATALRGQAQLAFPKQSRDSVWHREGLKLLDYWKNGQSIPWVRVHKLPEHVKFPHYVHVNVGLQCQTCHGDVQNMKEVYQFSSLRMGWCVECHRGGTELSEAEEAAVQQRSSFLRRVRSAAAGDLRGVRATWPRQRASTDCMVCHH